MSYTLTITFTPPSPTPSGGYRIKYWPVSNPSSITTVTASGSPHVITGLSGTSYTGTVEANCGGGNYSSVSNFTANLVGSCLTGTTSATGNCSSGQNSTFTLASGYQATVTMSGFYYTGSGTRTITGALLNNSNGVIQNFTYTQNGSGVGTTSPSSYTLSTPGTYRLQVNQVNCSTNGSGTATMTVGNCVSTSPTYYYYTGILCGGSIQNSFRSTISNLDNGTYIVKAMCAVCGNTEQCFDNIAPTNTPNSNDIVGTFSSCSQCASGSSGSSYCVEVTYNDLTQQSTECPGTTDSYTEYTFTLKDSNGNTVNAPSNVSITFTGWTNYPGGAGAYNGSATINSGQSTATTTVYTYQALDGSPGCGCPCPTTVSIDSASFEATIASPNTVTICSSSIPN